MRKVLVILAVFILSTSIFGQTPMIGLVSNSAPTTPEVPTTNITPFLTNFSIDNATPNHIDFTPNGDISLLTKQGFSVSGKTVDSINVVSNYIIVNSNFTWWDNTTIELQGGNGVIHDFYLEYVTNNINEPIATTQTLYAGATSQGSANGSNDANRMTYQAAINSASAGTTIWAKAGTVSSTLNFGGSDGTAINPIKFIGYKTTTGDAAEMTRTTGMSFNAAEMPLINGHSGNGVILTGSSYVIMKNFQVSGGSTFESAAIDLDGSNTQFIHLENYYVDGNSNQFGVRAKDSDANGHTNIRSKRAYISNCEQQGITLCKNYNLIEDNYVCSSYATAMDYYISVNGGETVGDGNNIVRNCYVERFAGDSQVGHGVSIKCGHKYSSLYVLITEKWLERTLVENNEIWNCGQSLEAKHFNAAFGVYRNNITLDDIGGYNGGVIVTNGAHDNVFINNIHRDGDYGVRFLASTEDDNALNGGKDNIFINILYDNPETGILLDEDNQGDNRIAEGNQFINCTFDSCAQLFSNPSPDYGTSGNNIRGSIISNCANDFSSGNNYGFVYNDTNFYNNTSFIVPSVTAISTFNPSYLNTTYFKPTNADLILYPTNALNRYDSNLVERNATLTTAGTRIHGNETP